MYVSQFSKKDLHFHLSARKQNKQYVKDRDAFKLFGIVPFFGEMGQGKTLTLIYFLVRIKLRYPKAIIVSNIELTEFEQVPFHDVSSLLQALETVKKDPDKKYIHYDTKDQFIDCLQMANNGKLGVIFITDEYQNYFSNQDSKNVPPAIIQQAAYNRKNKRVQLVTSQDYDQLVKAIRRRSIEAVKCRTFSLPLSYGPILTVYWFFNAKELDFNDNGRIRVGKPKKIGFFFHSKRLRDLYDTHQVIVTGDVANNVYKQDNISSLQVPRKKSTTKKSSVLFG